MVHNIPNTLAYDKLNNTIQCVADLQKFDLQTPTLKNKVP